MTSEVSVEEIKRDIAALYEKIERCNRSKNDLLSAIQSEKNTIDELQFYIGEDFRRLKKNQKLRYDIESLEHNINRCHQNVKVFEETISREDASINNLKYMIGVLVEDLERPKEIVFDAKTGKVIN